jgi:transcriptional regulator with XRE-family HTH domain
VAELAGVSAKWYAAFETGKSDRRFSAEFVHRVAEALRLDGRDRVWLFRLALPEAAAVAEHFESELTRAEESVNEARAATGRALASGVYRRLMAQEALTEVQAAAGRAIASAVYSQLAAQESSHAAQAAAGRALASDIYRKIVGTRRK